MGLTLKMFEKLPAFKPTGNFYTFLVCLFIAITFWLLNALTKTYDTQVEFPFGIKNLPKGQVLVKSLPSTIKLEVEGFGFNLLTFGGAKDDSVLLDISRIDLKKQGKFKAATVSPEKIYELIAGDFSSNYNLKKVLLDTLQLKLDERLTKVVTVNPDISVETESQFSVKEVVPIPNMVEVTGPKYVLDTIDFVKTEAKRFNKVDENLAFEVELLVPNNLSCETNNVEVKVEVDRLSEGSFTLPLTVEPDSLSNKIVLVPKHAEIKFLAPVSLYKTIEASSFEARVILDSSYTQISKLPILVEVNNPAAKLVSFEPQFVEFILISP